MSPVLEQTVAVEVVFRVQTISCNLKYLLEGYPVFTTMKVVVFIVAGGCITGGRGDQKPSSTMVLFDAPFKGILEDAASKHDLD